MSGGYFERAAAGPLFVVAVAAVAAGCGDIDDNDGPSLPYASEIVSFEPGDGAGYGQEQMPDVVLGPPAGGGTTQGSMEVLSLGAQGEIVLAFGDDQIVDGEGDDFIVFENPFWPGGDESQVFAELGEVSVSEDGQNWHRFDCGYERDDPPPYEGCAGWTPTQEFDATQVALDREVTGGDAFDLAELGLERARYVRIRDVWGRGEEPLSGFDLDAVGLIHSEGL